MRAAGHTPLLWRVYGYSAGLDWCALDSSYRASVAELPGCFATGATRTEALSRLATAIERHLLAVTEPSARLH